MSYQTIQTAVLTRVRAYNSGATFTTDTSAEDDWRVLDNSIGNLRGLRPDRARQERRDVRIARDWRDGGERDPHGQRR